MKTKNLAFYLLISLFLFSCSSDQFGENDFSAEQVELRGPQPNPPCESETVYDFHNLGTQLEYLANCNYTPPLCEDDQVVVSGSGVFTVTSYCSSGGCDDCADSLPSSWSTSDQAQIVADIYDRLSYYNVPCDLDHVKFYILTDCTLCQCGTICQGELVTSNCSISVGFEYTCCKYEPM